MGGSSKDPNKAAMKHQKKQMERLSKVEAPELQEYLLQNPELIGLLDAEELKDTQLDEIQLDPKMRENQLKVLEQLSQQADQGLTASDKFTMEKLLGDVASQEKSQQQAIESQMERRGTDSSGAAIMAKMANKQSAANQARDKAMQMAAQGQQNKMNALQQLAQQSGQMEQVDYGRQANTASARDAIAKANAMNRQNVNAANLAARQSIENQRVGTANQQAQVANQIAQQQFSNEMAKAGAQGNVANSMSSIAGSAPQGPSNMQKIGTVGGAVVGGIYGGPAGATAGAQAGGAIGGAMGADGGIMTNNYEDGGVAIKQHNNFKKKYLKQMQDEIMDERKYANGGTVNEYQNGGQVNQGFQPIPMDELKKQGYASTLGQDNDATSADINTTEKANEILEKEESNPMMSMEGLKVMGNVAGLMGKNKNATAPSYDLQNSQSGVENTLTPAASQEYDNPFANFQNRYKDGGIPQELVDIVMSNDQVLKNGNMEYTKKQEFYDERDRQDTPVYASDGMGDIIDSGMESYAGDRVDAKVNDGEAVINLPQQQRFMDLVRGKIGVDELGDDDIIEGVPKDYRDSLHEKIEEGSDSSDSKTKGLEKLLEMLGK